MSELPQIDPLKVALREAAKLRDLLSESTLRESQLEILAEALRDQRDELQKELDVLRTEVTPVQDITSLPGAV